MDKENTYYEKQRKFLENRTPWDELREARLAAGISQTDLAAQSGLSISQISNYESGRRDRLRISLGNLLSLANALGVTISDLVGTETGEVTRDWQDDAPDGRVAIKELNKKE